MAVPKKKAKKQNDNYTIYLKTQFGKFFSIQCNATTTIFDVKHSLEMQTGVAMSKMRMGPDRVAQKTGIPVNEYEFPDAVPLKDLGLKDGQVIIWRKFHNEYMKQIPAKTINEFKAKQKKRNKHGFGLMGSINPQDPVIDAVYEYNYKYFDQEKPANKGDDDDDSKIDDANVSSKYEWKTKVDIGKLLEKDKETMTAFRGCLEQRGWCLVEYPVNIQSVIDDICAKIFDGLSEKEKSDDWKSIAGMFGYNKFKDYKRVLRLLTSDLFEKFKSEYPKEIVNDLKTIGDCMDKLSKDIIECSLLSENDGNMWNCKNLKEFGEKSKVSMINGWNGDLNMKSGMIDFVQYFNKKMDDIDNTLAERYPMVGRGINVESHTDPGLFSLSFVSTAPGLELYDIPNKEWKLIPIDCGVLWCGEAAPTMTNGIVKSGIHRVTFNNNGKERFTAWYEACVDSQLPKWRLDEALKQMDPDYKSVDDEIAKVKVKKVKKSKNIKSVFGFFKKKRKNSS